jgi:nucleoid-associated protein YgaU
LPTIKEDSAAILPEDAQGDRVENEPEELPRTSQLLLGPLANADVMKRGNATVPELGDAQLVGAVAVLGVARRRRLVAAHRDADERLAGLDYSDIGVELAVLAPAGEEIKSAVAHELVRPEPGQAAGGIVRELEDEVDDPTVPVANSPVDDDAVVEPVEDGRQSFVRGFRFGLCPRLGPGLRIVGAHL